MEDVLFESILEVPEVCTVSGLERVSVPKALPEHLP